ncbi:O-antigen polymerase [Providencia manganoxydans]|uniref:O-antigen polymerase n=1 Tax=Providencia manganoxydans TaxID=2923283 RepID=UPI0034E56607
MKFKTNINLIFIYILTFSISLQIGYFFDGAHRYIPLRVVIIACFIYLFVVVSHKKINTNRLCFFIIALSIQLFYLIFWSNHYTEDLLSRSIGNFLYIICFGFIFNSMCEKLSKKQILTLLYFGCLFFLIILSIETILRFMYPSLNSSQLTSEAAQKIERDASLIYSGDLPLTEYFYSFKYSSILFFDSNYVGLIALMIVFILKYIHFSSTIIKTSLLEFIAVSLLVLSFSRSAILVVIIFYFYYYFVLSSHRNVRFISIVLFGILITISPLFIMDSNIQDGSFDTKVQIMLSLYNKFDEIPAVQLLFGAGPVVGGYIFSYKDGEYAHALLPLIMGELGILGILIILFFYAYIILKLKKWGVMFLIVTFIPGLSLIDPYQIFYYWSIIAIFRAEYNKQE